MNTSSLSSTSALLFCRMCQAVYRQPKLLPCLHSFCRPCLVDIVAQEADGTVIVCPLCSHKTTLPSSGVAGIPDNCFLSRMCQEYVTEVQSHIEARTLYPASFRSSSEFTALRSQLTDELSQSMYSPPPSNLHRHSSHMGSRHHEEESLSHATITDISSAPNHTANTLEAIYNMSRLQAKIMSLQGEALRVTYAIDHVNQCTIEWHQHKNDLKKAVERRSAQFQFFIKRMEHQLITQIYGKHVDDEFYVESDKGKTELRKILKKILHEVSVLKSIQEHGKDTEVNALSSNLLGQSVGLTDVFLKKFNFDMNVPIQPIEEMVAECFGAIRLNSEESNIFAPEIIDFKDLPMANFAEPADGDGFSTYYNEGRETPILEEEELEGISTSKSAQRSFSDSSSIQYNTGHTVDKDDVREHLVQFQNARETLRSRRREILVRGQQSRHDASPLRDETQRRPRVTLKKGRVQSLDRIATTPATKKSTKTGLTTRSNKHEIINDAFREPDKKSQNQGASDPQPKHSITFQCGLITEDLNVTSPVTEDASLPKNPQRKLVKQSSDPHSTHGMIFFHEETSDSEMPLPSYPGSETEQLSRSRFLDPNNSCLFTGRRHSSDHYTFISHGEDPSQELSHDKTTTRLLRRAISSATDRKTKMEFLRGNWQKRKEILIQSEGFMSPDSVAKHTVKSSTHVRSPTRSGSPSNVTAPIHTSDVEYHSRDSSNDSSFGHMHQIIESQPYDKNVLDDIEENNKDVKSYATSSVGIPLSEQSTFSHTASVSQQSVLDTPVSIHAPALTAVSGARRRHTMDIGQTAKMNARQMTSRDTPSSTAKIYHDISSVNQSSMLTPGEFRFGDNSSTLGSSNGSDTAILPLTKSTVIKKATMEEIARGLPSPQEGMQEKTTSGQYVSSEPSAALASESPPSSPLPQTPSSPTASDGAQKVRMREIARKKRERWRHLTIH